MASLQHRSTNDYENCTNESRRPWYREKDSMETNQKARKAYEALLTVTARIPVTAEYAEFSKGVKNLSQQYFGKPYGKEEVSS
ncbi:receptor-type guanylate cyclase gcy-28 [Trichonephila clavipes]|nr:receptor-type guanylate cyclase gcy-28 [Trichonephila clavipes]